MYKKYTDLDLVQFIREDDREAYAELYRRYGIILLSHAFHMLNDRESAKDIVQEVFALFWEKRKKLELSRNLAGFLFTSIRNLILNQIAHQKVQEKYVDSMILFSDQHVPTADYHIREKQLTEYITHQIENLPPQMRKIFELSRYEQLSHKEIAEKLGLAEQTISKQITNALKILREKLGILIYLYFLLN